MTNGSSTLGTEAVRHQCARLHRRSHAVALLRVARLLIPVPVARLLPILLPVRILTVLQVRAIHDHGARPRLLGLLWLLLRGTVASTQSMHGSQHSGARAWKGCVQRRRYTADSGHIAIR